MRKEKLPEVVITYAILIIVSFIFFFPVFWLVMASFSATGSIYDYDGFFPKSFSIGTYYKLFTDTQMYDYPVWLRNTLFVAVFSCIFHLPVFWWQEYPMGLLNSKAFYVFYMSKQKSCLCAAFLLIPQNRKKNMLTTDYTKAL